jgi:hypothetical protein
VPAPPRVPQKPGPPAPAPRAEGAIDKARREKDELEAEATRLEEELEELKARYEQYFLGIERKEPSRWREELRKSVLRVKEAFTRNTGLKFRIQSLHARYLSYERLWLRSAKEKEEGTYRRDLFKARLHRKGPVAPPQKAPGPEAKPAPAASRPAASPAAAQPAARAPAPKAAPSPAPGAMPEPQLRALYDAYVAAKKRCNEDVSRLSYDAVARTVSKQIPELMTRYKAKSVEFRVEVRDGKAILKAVPKV